MGAGVVSASTGTSASGHPWWIGIAAWAGALVLRGLAATWRLEWRGTGAIEAAAARGEGCIYALWHSTLVTLTVTHRDRGVAALISRHRDGELVARVAERLGYRTARGSSTRGGESGMRAMIEYAAEGRRLAVTPDGPRGPAEVLKPGVVGIASAAGQPVWPITASAGSAWTLRSWDRMRIPKPFARVLIVAGDPLRVPRGLSNAETEAWRVRIERALRELTDAVRREAGEPA